MCAEIEYLHAFDCALNTLGISSLSCIERDLWIKNTTGVSVKAGACIYRASRLGKMPRSCMY